MLANFVFCINFLCSSVETGAGAAQTDTEPTQSQTVSPSVPGADSVGEPVSISETISTVLANAGHTLEGSVAELVLSPLRLAFATKNLKILESALDCLHVSICLDGFVLYFNVDEGCFSHCLLVPNMC